MIYVLWIVGIVVFVLILLWLNAVRATGSVLRKLDEKIEPAITAIENHSESTGNIINDLAENPETRNHLFNWLKENNKENLFPDKYRELEKIAESELVQWLMHPNELKESPVKIELVRKVLVKKENKQGNYYLFKFSVDDNHWASKNGWMVGVAGPYWDDEEIPYKSIGTFSEFIPFDDMTEDQHLELLNQKIKKWGFVVPT